MNPVSHCLASCISIVELAQGETRHILLDKLNFHLTLIMIPAVREPNKV